MKRLLVLFFALFACGESELPPSPSTTDGRNTVFGCEPECAPGFACDDGTCVPACEPICPEGTTCQPDGSCEFDLGPGPGEDFERNSCGGLGELEGLPGTECGPCETGRWLCETENNVTCADPIGLNACGVCGELEGIPGGICAEESRWACNEDGTLACVSWFDANPCLGTTALEGVPGRPCGDCHEGYYVCDGRNESSCVIPDDAPLVCECESGVSPVIECGTVAGLCERGVRYCEPDGLYGACVRADLGESCLEDVDCPANYLCIDEQTRPVETRFDECVIGTEPSCARRVCRLPVGEISCTSDDQCINRSACAGGVCRPLVVRPNREFCDSLDNNCDGRIDDDEDRTEICGSCPYNMMLVVNIHREFGRRRICVDRYEASRPDATATAMGEDTAYSRPVAGVIPWHGVSAEEAVAACAGAEYNAQIPGGVAERRLCVVDEWPVACNIEEYDYPWGDGFVPGRCHDASVGSLSPAPTGSFPDCDNIVPGGTFPNFDFPGNVAEWVRGEDGALLAGGSFRDGDSSALACESVEDFDGEIDNHIGFRCCAATIAITPR